MSLKKTNPKLSKNLKTNYDFLNNTPQNYINFAKYITILIFVKLFLTKFQKTFPINLYIKTTKKAAPPTEQPFFLIQKITLKLS